MDLRGSHVLFEMLIKGMQTYNGHNEGEARFLLI